MSLFREFVRTYVRRVLIIGPFFAIITFIPPYPLETKWATAAAFFVILLLAQLPELFVVLGNAHRQRREDERDFDEDAAVGDPSLPQSRKERRAIARRREGGYL